MATAYQTPVVDRKPLKARPRPETDRKQLRDDINSRYENTLSYLGR